MEPYRPFVDNLVYQLHQKDQDENMLLTTEDKHHLLSLATVDAIYGKRKSPLMVGLSHTTKSLADCFQGKKRKIVYPELHQP